MSGRAPSGLFAYVMILALVGALTWYHQSRVIGWVGTRYLAFLSRRDARSGDLTHRRQVLTRIHRRLLMPPPADALVPELFDVSTELTPRVARGEMSLAWSAYLYTVYLRDLIDQRPTGEPRRSRDEVAAVIAGQIEFFSIREGPDVPGTRLGELLDVNDEDVLTLEEIEAAHREGRTLDLGRETIRR